MRILLWSFNMSLRDEGVTGVNDTGPGVEEVKDIFDIGVEGSGNVAG
jgi:hypothetical protein